MLNTEQITDLHRLYWSERWSIRKIERHLKMGWRTIRKYLKAPAQGPALRSRSSKLDSFKGNIAEWLEKDPLVWEEQFGAREIADLKISLGSYAAAGQLQQRPSPAGGGIFKRPWFRFF